MIPFTLISIAIVAGLFFGMMLFLEVGRRIGLHRFAKFGEPARAGVGVVDGVVYGLLSLLLGFTFSGAAARFDHRRELVANAGHAMEIAWDRTLVLPEADRQPIRDAFKRYVDALIASYTRRDRSDPFAEPPSVETARRDVWDRSVAVCIAPEGEKSRMLLLPALNDMFGVIYQERLARRIHPPVAIFAMLGIAALASALFGGYGLAKSSVRNWMYVTGVAATVAMTAYVIIELEYPRLGAVRVDNMDRALIDLRATMQ
jgi:hypothetical protein